MTHRAPFPKLYFVFGHILYKKRKWESRDDGWDMWISQKLFLDRVWSPRLGWLQMKLFDIVWRYFGIVFSIHQAVRFTCRNVSPTPGFGQDNPFSLLLKLFVEKTAILLGTPFWILQPLALLGNQRSVFVTSIGNLTEVDISQGLK